MTSRLALLAALLALVAALFLVFQEGSPTARVGTPDKIGSDSEVLAADRSPDGQTASGEDHQGGPERSDLDNPDPEQTGLAAAEEIPSFRGFVVDSEGSPLAEVSLYARGFPRWGFRGIGQTDGALADWETVTAPDGAFLFPSPPRDNLYFSILVRHPDYAPFDLVNQPATPGRTRDLGELALNHGFRLQGTVVDPRGTPVDGAEILAYRDPNTVNGVQVLAKMDPLDGFLATTDREGHFQFTRLPTGAVRFKASAEGYFESWSAVATAVADGESSGLEITLREGVDLHGVVMDQNRQGVADARVLLSGRGQGLEDSYQVEVISDRQGQFTLPAPSDLSRATLTAGADGFFLERRNLRIEQLKERVELLLTPAPELLGVVVDEAGAAVPGATVRLVEQGKDTLDPRSMPANDETTSDEEGSFTLHPKLRSAWGGRFTVYAWDEGHAVGHSDLFRLSESKGFQMPDLRIVLAQGFRASGRVLDSGGQELAGARVVLRKLRYQRKSRLGNSNPAQARGGDIFATTLSAEDGSFAFEGLATGDWRLEAHGVGHSPVESEDFSLIDSDFEATLQLVAEASIAGQVVGDLAAFSRLRVTANAPGQETIDTMVDAEGNFRLPAMMPGTWKVELRESEAAGSAMGFVYGNRPPLAHQEGVELVAGQETLVTLELSLSGRSRLLGSARVNGEAAVGYQIFALPQEGASGGDPRIAARERQAKIRTAEVDYTGSFQMSGLDSGDYWVLITAPGQYPQGIWDAGSGAPRGLGRQGVSLRDGAESNLRFDILLGSLDLQVSDGRGSARINLIPSPDDGRLTQSTYVGRRGSTLRDLPAGGYQLQVNQGGGQWANQNITVPAGGTGQVTITLPERDTKSRR